MSLPSSPPPLNKAIFVAADVALLAAAWLIGAYSAHPLPEAALVAIVVCVMAAAAAGAFPFVLDYTRRQEEALDERQRSLEGLARTVGEAAEQIGIAAAGLQEIAAAAQHNLKAAEEMPEKLAKSLQELQEKLESVNAEEREELERELASLRASESERLAATAEKIARAAADWSKAESAGLRHVVAARTFISELEQKIAALKAAAAGFNPTVAGTPDVAASFTARRKGGIKEYLQPAAPEPAAAEPPPPSPDSGGAAAPPVSPPPRRKAAKESAAPAAQRFEGEGISTGSGENPPTAAPPPVPSSSDASAPDASAAEEEDNGETAVATLAPSSDPEAPKAAARKRPQRQSPLPEPSLGLDDAALRSAAPGPVAAPSPDGATRLLVTAYIGIGNRLFIRGEGPGLSWDEGVPLQFVSIGKWRWETTEATGPVRFKLYKNDRDACVLATERIEAGQQQELTATW